MLYLLELMMSNIPRNSWGFVRFAIFICVVRMHSSSPAEVLRPRGVSLDRKVFYEPAKEFHCIDGSGVFPFHFVNDDYCDCLDGSDEPGTAACSESLFHCVNAGHTSKEIPSTQINDNICDCCDGSDEYNSSMECVNSCMELGNRAREEAHKREELLRKGYQLFEEYCVEGKKIKENNKAKLENLKKLEEEADKMKIEKEAIKNDAESREKAALAKYEALKTDLKKEAEEVEMLKHENEEKQKAYEAFQELDLNKDGMLSVDEIQKFPKFDINRDGFVSEEEGKFFLHMKASMEMEEFISTGWMIMKPVYTLDRVPTHTSATGETPTIVGDKVLQTGYDESESEPYENEVLTGDLLDDEEEESEEPEQPAEFSTDEKPVYDEETQKVVDDASETRKAFKEAVDKLEEIQNEIRQTEADIEADFGVQDQFAVLKGQCLEYTDREYTYKFCPFDKAGQMPRSGGVEISLGKWGHWAGPEDNKYSKMKYENGQSCWNGPARSVMVLLFCGVENAILSASEPNRCEYLFEFSTPALCMSDEVIPLVHEHTEL